MPFIAIALANWRITIIAALVVAVGVFLIVEREMLLKQGGQAELQKIEEANHVAHEKADVGSKSVDDCIAAGRVWDRDSGLCIDAAR